MSTVPTLSEIVAQHQRLSSFVVHTPTVRRDSWLDDRDVVFKAELLQKTGTFKLRGALTRMLSLTDEEKTKGVVCGTGGNHGTAVAYAAKLLGVSAKIIVPDFINPYRYQAILRLGGEVSKESSVARVMERMDEVASLESRVVVHPFDHPMTTLGTATLGYEFYQQCQTLDNVIVPIGGGGLISGVALAMKRLNPKVRVYGVEPIGANAMSLAMAQNEPTPVPGGPKSIADSLCAPSALAYSFSVVKDNVDEVVLVSDDEIKAAMKLIAERLKFMVEPACAAATAAFLGPLAEKTRGQTTGILLCGSNIDVETFHGFVTGLA